MMTPFYMGKCLKWKLWFKPGLQLFILMIVLLLMGGCGEIFIGKPKEKLTSDMIKERTESYKQLYKKEASLEDCACFDLKPRIHSIGTSSILVFESGHPLEILVEGQDLHLPPCSNAEVKIGGTVPGVKGIDYKIMDGTYTGGAFRIVLNEGYVSRLKSGYQLDVWVSIDSPSTGYLPCPWKDENEQLNIEDANHNRTLTFASRSMTVYETNDYADKFLATRVKPYNIKAFPLPKEETRVLFGPIIADNFFAVRLSVRNDTTADKLISTGMILASGRAIVDPGEKGNSFTLPIEITPQGLEQVYTTLDDEEVNQFRPRVFRGLEFVGALATGINVAFGSSVDLTEGLSLFTGIFIPESKKFWNDRHPRYERNIVSFAMQDLTKVPRGSVIGHKYIFFSKNKIETIINDPNLVGPFKSGFKLIERSLSDQPEPPNAAIISVAFDNLDIPFENVFSVETKSILEKLSSAQLDLRSLIDQLQNIRVAWDINSPGRLLGIINKGEIDNAGKNIELTLTKLKSTEKMATSGFTGFSEKKIATSKEVEKLLPVIQTSEQAVLKILQDKTVAVPDGLSGIEASGFITEWENTIQAIESLGGDPVLTKTSKQSIDGLSKSLKDHTISLKNAFDDFGKELIPKMKSVQPVLTSLSDQERTLSSAKNTLGNLKNDVSRLLNVETNLPDPMIKTMKLAEEKLNNADAILVLVLDALSEPVNFIRAGDLPVTLTRLKTANEELEKVAIPLDDAKGILNDIVAFQHTDIEEQNDAIDRVKMNLKGKLNLNSAMFITEASNLSKWIHSIPDVQAPLQTMNISLKKAETAMGKAAEQLNSLKTENAAPSSYERLIHNVKTLGNVSVALAPHRVLKDLTDSGTFGQKRLRDHQIKIESLRKSYTRGGDISIYENDLKEITETIAQCNRALGFYRLSARTMLEALKMNPDSALGARFSTYSPNKLFSSDEIADEIKDLDVYYIDPLKRQHLELNIVSELN
jgi:hypothetical protein